MKKIAQAHLSSSSSISLNDTINPEESETRCKICFEEKMPLVTLCDCTGSIAYVHEDCILDWIALKMEKSELIQIPKCQICKTKFSATMKIGSKKIDNTLLYEKMKKTSKKDWLLLVASVIGVVFAVITMLISVFNLIMGKYFVFDTLFAFVQSFATTLFVNFIFPYTFMDNCIKYYKKKWKVIQDCKVQLVEVTLLPKKILKV